METVSKFTLNPLATCFVPSSMKYRNTYDVFSVPTHKNFVNEQVAAKNGQAPVITNNQNTATEYFQVMEVQSLPIKEKCLEEPFVTIEEVRETTSDSNQKEVAEESILVTKALSTVNEISKHETPAKSNDKENSKHISKGKNLRKLDISLTNQTVMGKISALLKGGTKNFWLLLPFAVRSLLVMEFFYRMGLKTISLNMTMTSHLCSVLKPNFNAITYPKNRKAKKTNRKVKKEKCYCPPMFGWIIPPKVFGNPLKLPETCGKDGIHTSYVDGSSTQTQSELSKSFESSNIKDDTILEQCSLELKAVIKDVCDSLSSNDQSIGDIDQDLVSKPRKRPVWENATKKSEEKHLTLDIIDDGNHPLLQETFAMDSEDTEIPKIQEFLGKAFSLHKNSVGEEILPSEPVCNPPCSIWCNKVPPPAKDAYKRFIKKMDSESTVCHKTDIKVLKKPLYKRCFSADDTPKTYDKIPLLSASSFESRERLLLLRKDPVSFIKQSSPSALKDINRKSRSKSSVVSEQVATEDSSNESCSDKWSVYDGAGSMWQPLPECVPSCDAAQKQSHRKAREMRRQKSVC